MYIYIIFGVYIYYYIYKAFSILYKMLYNYIYIIFVYTHRFVLCTYVYVYAWVCIYICIYTTYIYMLTQKPIQLSLSDTHLCNLFIWKPEEKLVCNTMYNPLTSGNDINMASKAHIWPKNRSHLSLAHFCVPGTGKHRFRIHAFHCISSCGWILDRHDLWSISVDW